MTDTLESQDLAALSAALPASVLLTGGSGLGGAIAAHATGQHNATQPQETPPRAGRGVVLSGSCSQMTKQALDIDRCRQDPDAYARALAEWVRDLQRPLWLALKSGNFGDPDFFSKAQELYHD